METRRAVIRKSRLKVNFPTESPSTKERKKILKELEILSSVKRPYFRLTIKVNINL